MTDNIRRTDFRRRSPFWSSMRIVAVCVVFFFILYQAVRFTQLEFVNYFPQYHLTAKVTDFHMAEAGVYFFSYEYFLDGHKHTGGSSTGDHAWFRERTPEFAVGKTIKINVIKDAKGQCISGISDSVLWIMPIWFIFVLSGLSFGLYFAVRATLR
jgi:hypothetical protein